MRAGDELWLCHLRFVTASRAEVACGFLGWVSCHVHGTLWLRGMRVRRLTSGRIKIKVRRGGRDMFEGLVRIDDPTRARIQELILADSGFRFALDAIGVHVSEVRHA